MLILTFLVNYYHQETHPGVGFNYAYVPGILMLVAFSLSFILFTKNNLKWAYFQYTIDGVRSFFMKSLQPIYLNIINFDLIKDTRRIS